MLGRKVVRHSPAMLSRERITGKLEQVRAADEAETSQVLPEDKDKTGAGGKGVDAQTMSSVMGMFGG